MSLIANLEHLATAPGVVAVTVDAPGAQRAFRGAESWSPVLDAALSLFAKTEEDTIRLVIGPHTVIVQREHGQNVAVVLPTGHAIAKSLRRMIRRLSRKERGPVAARPRVSTTAATATAAPPTESHPNATPHPAAA